MLYSVRKLRAKVSTEWGLEMAIYGYARVSTDGQTLATQDAALKAAGCTKIFAEKISGARSDRPQLAKLLKSIGDGDTVIVTWLDRLARSTRDLLNTLHAIGKAGATFKSLADAWADTTTPHGRLMLTVLGGLAEFERELIMARTGEGRARAKAAGNHMGRPSKLTPFQRQEALKRREAGERLTDIARTYGVAHTTIGRL
jgi:DNA invertase Pin-like site-specific DNA recombinase